MFVDVYTGVHTCNRAQYLFNEQQPQKQNDVQKTSEASKTLPDNLEKTFNLPNKHLLGSSDDSGAMLDTECILYGGKNKNADMTFTLMEPTVYCGITEPTTNKNYRLTTLFKAHKAFQGHFYRQRISVGLQ